MARPHLRYELSSPREKQAQRHRAGNGRRRHHHDLQGDQRQVAGLLRQRRGGLGGDPGDIGACRQERCLERIDVVQKSGKLGVHSRSESRTGPPWYRFQQPTACYPADCGRQLCCGGRQSIPSSR